MSTSCSHPAAVVAELMEGPAPCPDAAWIAEALNADARLFAELVEGLQPYLEAENAWIAEALDAELLRWNELVGGIQVTNAEYLG